MRKSFLLSLTALVFGIAGGVLRAFELRFGFEPDTGLPILGNGWTTALLILCAAAAVLIGALCFTRVKAARAEAGAQYVSVSSAAHSGARVAASLLIAVSGVLGILSWLDTPKATNLISSILAIFAGFCLLALAFDQKKGVVRQEDGFYAVVPVYWMAFFTIVFFQQCVANPVTESYIHLLLGLICAMLALFFFASHYNNRHKPGKTAFFSLMGAVLLLTSALGALFAGRAAEDVQMNLTALALIVLLFSNAVLIIDNNERARRREADAPRSEENKEHEGE